jgi:hypothetical protein
MSRPHQTESQPRRLPGEVSPFHWREFTERETGPGREATKRQLADKARRQVPARDQAERILAQRWSGAYSKAGPA